MNREEKYDAVNKCMTLEQLSKAVLLLADDDGMIQGRSRKFSAKKMSHACMSYDMLPDSVLTREYGIRQQGIMITKADYNLV
ncbi:MAG: hypothetical protein KUG81_07580 [Gammaproteobacteria bacterium]|nr:hypothetical protein [Gammaproteobacteria bacterium]